MSRIAGSLETGVELPDVDEEVPWEDELVGDVFVFEGWVVGVGLVFEFPVGEPLSELSPEFAGVVLVVVDGFELGSVVEVC